MDSNNVQTQKSFSEKWHKNQDLAFSLTNTPGSDIYNWILTRNGFANADALRKFLSNKKAILDGGCGNGRVTKLLRDHSDASTTKVVGINFSAHDVAKENLAQEPNTEFYYANLREDLSKFGEFDFIYSQEVLHHTGDAAHSFSNLCKILAPGGEIAIYVYKIKAPIREFTDDYVRDKISTMSYEDSMKVCRDITELGKVLSEHDAEVTIPDVEILGIKAGTYPIQRLLYHFFAKCFWNAELDYEANVVINYDWYHPQDCTRHTMPEVLQWFENEKLEVVQQCEDFYGITVRGRKASNSA